MTYMTYMYMTYMTYDGPQLRMRPFRTDPPKLTDFRSYPLKILLDADIGKVHTQRIRDRADNSD